MVKFIFKNISKLACFYFKQVLLFPTSTTSKELQMQILKVINKLKKITTAWLNIEIEGKGLLTLLAEVATVVTGCSALFILMILLGA